jgi:aminocarboxymuconate-semialdehyde decarboxylase
LASTQNVDDDGSSILKAIRPYGPTAARKHGRPGRETRPHSITIDIHSHVSVPAAAAFVRPHFDISTMPLALFATPETKAVNAQQEVDRSMLFTGDGVSDRLRDLDDMGIDIQLVMPPPPQCYYTLPIEVGMRAAQIINEGIAEYVARKPDRFVGLGTVAMPDGREAAVELERAMRSLDLKGVQILTNVAGRELSDPEFAPFWAKAEELGALVVIHPNGFTEGSRLRHFYFNNVIGNPLETSIALHYLIFDGVLERHPNLKLLAVHGGGYLGAYSGRIDHAWGARPDCHADLSRPPTYYLKKIFVDGVVFTPRQLAGLIEVFGDDHVLIGTDYPFDMAESDPLGHLASIETLEAKAAQAIAGGNARKLLGI